MSFNAITNLLKFELIVVGAFDDDAFASVVGVGAAVVVGAGDGVLVGMLLLGAELEVVSIGVGRLC